MSDATTKAYGPFTEKLAALETQLAAERKRADEAERLELERDDARRRIDCGELEGEGCRLDDDVCFRHYLAERSNDAFDIEEALGATNEDDLCGWHQIAPFAEKVRRERDELRARVGELERELRESEIAETTVCGERDELQRELAEERAKTIIEVIEFVEGIVTGTVPNYAVERIAWILRQKFAAQTAEGIGLPGGATPPPVTGEPTKWRLQQTADDIAAGKIPDLIEESGLGDVIRQAMGEPSPTAKEPK